MTENKWSAGIVFLCMSEICLFCNHKKMNQRGANAAARISFTKIAGK